MKIVFAAVLLAAVSAAMMLGAGAVPRQAQPTTDEAKPPAQGETPSTEKQPVADTSPAYVKLTTTMGDIVLELDRERAPITTANFLQYVESGHYDGTIFHRVIPGFVIQGGGFDKDMNQKPTQPPIKNEWKNGLKNKKGTISMARLPGPDTATSQFFINLVDNPNLDGSDRTPGYAVFGKVISGMDVVEKIKDVRTTTRGPHQGVPVEPIIVTKAQKITAEEAKAADAPR